MESFKSDGLLITFILILALMLTEGFENAFTIVSILYFGIIFSYVPIFTSLGVTFGQKLMGIRVRKIKHPEMKVSIVQAYVRFATKLLLGWLSFITINFNPEHRAIHDLTASTVVISKK